MRAWEQAPAYNLGGISHYTQAVRRALELHKDAKVLSPRAVFHRLHSHLFIIEEHTPTEGYWVTDTFIDAYIPFVPEFAVFYIIWYPLFAAVGIPTIIKDEGAFRRWMYYNMFTLSATLILDVIIPNGQHLRPQGVEATTSEPG